MSVVNESWTTSRDYPYPPARVFAAWADPTFEATPAGTHLVYTEQGAYLDGLDSASSRSDGTTSQLDRLADVLSRIS